MGPLPLGPSAQHSGAYTTGPVVRVISLPHCTLSKFPMVVVETEMLSHSNHWAFFHTRFTWNVLNSLRTGDL